MEAPSPTPDIVVLSACRVDLARQVVERDGRVQRLRTKEAQLLAYFLSHPATEISRDELLTEVWGYRAGIVTRTVDNTVRRLRCCIEANPDEPDHVITVYGVGYRFVPPAPRATASPRLPQFADALYGRDEALAQLGPLLDAPGFVTLLGPPGVGKTRLALAHASAWHTGPALFCDLSALRTEGEVISAVARELGLPPATDLDAGRRAIGQTLQAQAPILLVLDNFEQVAECAGHLPAGFSGAAPKASLIVTSRVRLRVSGERCLDVEPLPSEVAAALFVDRARAVRAGFDAPREQVVALMDALGGLPLAVEMAASTTQVLTVQQIADAGVGALRSDRRDRPDRHESLARAFETSWELLDEPSRRTLLGCSVFPATFDLDAIAAVSGHPSTELLPILQGLVSHSLLVTSFDDGPARFRLLPALHPFVTARVEDPSGLMEAHAQWVHAVATPLRERIRCGDPEAIHRIDRLADDLWAVSERPVPEALAIDAARSLALGLLRRAASSRVLALLDRALARAHAGAEDQLGAVRLDRASAHTVYGNLDDARADLTQARTHGLAPDRQAQASLIEGVLLHYGGQIEDARAVYQAAVEATEPEDHIARGRLLINLGITRRQQEDPDGAHACYREALDAAKRADDRVTLCRLESSLGILARASGDLPTAQAHFQRRIEQAVHIGDLQAEAGGLLNQALTSRCLGDLQASLSLAEEAIETARAVGSRRLEGHGQYRVACALVALDDPATALAPASAALSMLREVGDVYLEAHTLQTIARIHALQGDFARALRFTEDALEAHERAEDREATRIARGMRAALLAHAGRSEEALQALQAALDDAGSDPPEALKLHALSAATPPPTEQAVRDALAQADDNLTDIALQDAAQLLRAQRARPAP